MESVDTSLVRIPLRTAPIDTIRAATLAVLCELPPSRRPLVQDGRLVVVRRREDGEPYVHVLDRRDMVALLAGTIDYVNRKASGGDDHVAPPAAIVDAILGAGHWPFRPLAGVSRVPLVRPDGTPVLESGYDLQTGYFVDVGANLVRAFETLELDFSPMEAARGVLGDIVTDFPFADAASRANALGFMLTPYLRPLMSGPVPLAAFLARGPGVGKTTLAQLTALAGVGDEPSVFAEPESDQEFRKKITGHLRTGGRFALFDNLSRRLSSDSLAAVLTSRTWKDRLLAKSTNITVPNGSLWAVTGNSLEVAGDLPRRTVLIALRNDHARPWTRTDFRIPELLSHVKRGLPQIQAALLILCTEWARAGMPRVPVPGLGSFETWASTVGSVLHHAGIPGFLENRDVLQVAGDTAVREMERFVRAIMGRFPDEFTARDVLTAVRQCSVEPETVPEELGGLSGVDASRQIGKAFARWEGRPLADDGLALERVRRESRGGTVVWRPRTRELAADDGEPGRRRGNDIHGQ